MSDRRDNVRRWMATALVGAVLSLVATPSAVAAPGDWSNSACSGVDATSSATYDAVSSVTLSHTTSGTDRLMLVGVSLNNDNSETVSGITYDGVALTLVDSVATVDDARVEIWRLVAPPTGTHDVVVTFDATLARGGTVGVMTFTGVDQSTPLGPSATNANQDGTEASVDVASAADELVFGVMALEDSGPPSVGALQADRWNLDNADRDFGAGSTENGAGTVTMSWTWSSSDHWAAAGVSIKPITTCVTLSGTVTDDSESDIRAGGSTIVLTLTGDTWVAAGAPFDAERQNIIDGLTSAQSETNGWNAVVKPGLSVTDVVRTSDTVVTITLPAFASYDITATETVTATVPASALVNSTSDLVASPTFSIVPEGAAACTALAVDNVSTNTGSGSTLTISHTVSGTTRLLLVAPQWNSGSSPVTVTSVTYDGIALTREGGAAESDDAAVDIWRLLDPPTGTHDVVITYDTAPTYDHIGGVMSFNGVDQSSPLGSIATNWESAAGSNDPAVVDVATADNELVFAGATAETPNTMVWQGSQPEHWHLDPQSNRTIGAGATEPGTAPTVTMQWNDVVDHWAAAGISIKPCVVAELSGTVTDDSEADIQAGGSTIVLTLTGDTWVAAGAPFDAERQNIIDGLTSAQSETNGWNAVVKPGLSVTDVVRTSDTVVTITLPAFASYDITATETITATVPASALANSTSDLVASPTFDVVRPQVNVEPNSAGTVLSSASAQTISFLHTVTNDGDRTDSYALNVFSERGWSIELVDPATMSVIATDSNGDGTWDSGAPNTGSLSPGASVSYRVRVTVPGGTAVGTVDSVELRATSDAHSSYRGSAFDEISVADGTIAGAGDVLVVPDNSTNALAGESVDYAHTVTNRTGATETFNLQADSSQSWTTTIYRDSNGDGVYTPSVDAAITSTDSLADGASQTIFVVVDVPGGASTGTVDITHVTAKSQSDPDVGGIASDTTTVGDDDSLTDFDFSGGGSQVVDPGDTPVYPGTLTNDGSAADTYEFTISASDYGPGGPVADGLDHASQLWIDTTGNGTPDTQIGRDDDGDGTWDFVDAAYDADTDGNPDVSVASGASLAYELRRPVDAAQTPYRDPVSLTATSSASGTADSVTITTAVLAATRAVIDGFVAYGSDDGVVVQWQTASEHGTVGFNLMRLDERSGEYVRVNDKLLPGLLHSRNGGTYRYLDPRVSVGDIVTYQLVELEATGNELTYGPYTVLVELDAEAAGVDPSPATDSPVANYERIERALSALQEARITAKKQAREEARAAKLAREGPRAKIMARAAGVYHVGSQSIASALGRSVREVERLIGSNRLALTNRGKRVATLAAAGNTGLFFYNEGIDSQYTLDDVYWLEEGKGLAMETRDGGRPAPTAGGRFTHTSHAAGNRYTLTHLFDDPDDDYWMWDFRFEDMVFPMYESSFTVSSPGVEASRAGSASLSVRLHGGSETDLDIDHRATVTFNGTKLGTAEFDGLAPHTATFEVPLELLNDGDNRVEIGGRATGLADQPSIFYINDFTLTYPRRYAARDGALALSSAGHGVVSITGFPSDAVEIWDLSEPRRPKRVLDAAIDELAGGYRVSFEAGTKPTRYLAFASVAARAPEGIIADVPSDLKRRHHGIDYLIITASDMMDAARRLAEYRRGQGLRSKVVDIEDIYDEFNHGIKNADAIWAFLHYAHTRWRMGPRYVVLAGEGSFDYKNHLGHGDSIIPTLLTPTPHGLFPSDNLYADVVGNDWLPEMAIGRLPVIDADELDAVTAKIRAYEQSGADWQRRVVLAADAPDLGGNFTADSERLANLMPESYDLERIHLDRMLPSDARERMLGAFSSGRAFINFIGHSGHMSIGNTNLINVFDVPGLDNAERLPVVTAFTCLAGQFGFPGQEAIGEALVIAPQGGAAAMWSPSGLSLNNRARLLGEGFYSATFEAGELVIGEVILQAQARYAKDGVDKYLLDVYNLIGDPATVMK